MDKRSLRITWYIFSKKNTDVSRLNWIIKIRLCRTWNFTSNIRDPAVWYAQTDRKIADCYGAIANLCKLSEDHSDYLPLPILDFQIFLPFRRPKDLKPQLSCFPSFFTAKDQNKIGAKNNMVPTSILRWLCLNSSISLCCQLLKRLSWKTPPQAEGDGFKGCSTYRDHCSGLISVSGHCFSEMYPSNHQRGRKKKLPSPFYVITRTKQTSLKETLGTFRVPFFPRKKKKHQLDMGVSKK